MTEYAVVDLCEGLGVRIKKFYVLSKQKATTFITFNKKFHTSQ